MKKLLLTAAAILATLNMYGQGSQGVIGFSGLGVTADKRVYVIDSPGQPITTGTAANSAYSYAFFWSPVGQNQWTQIGASANFLDAAAGQFAGGNRTINGLSAGGGIVDIQAKAWERAFGASYDAVVTGGQGHAGQSVIVTMKSKDPANSLETVPSLTSQAQWTGFGLAPVPEPSVIGLGILGAGALLMLRRRK